VSKLLKNGAGKPGYCKLCSFDDHRLQDEFDKRVLDYSPKKLNEWLAARVEGHKPVNRQTIYSHRDHVRNPKDKLVSAVRKRTLEHGVQKQRVSEQEFLDAVVAMGQAKAQADPDSVTIDHALKAASLKLQSKQKGNAHQTLVAIFTGNLPDTIEGEVVEVNES
jgi:hypothetical protein